MKADTINGVPTIACGGMYVSAKDSSALEWNHPINLAFGHVDLHSVDILSFQGHPAHLQANGCLDFHLAKDASGAEWNTNQTMDTEVYDGDPVAMAANDNRLYLAYIADVDDSEELRVMKIE
jgi:hypothetical protein